MPSSFDFARAPGHLIRRAQQIAVAEFARALADFDITPVQFALLNAVIDAPGVDQVTLAKTVAFDPATSGSVIGRLEAKGWLRRQADAQDRRRKLLFVTPEGAQAVAHMSAAVSQVQQNILAPLTTADQVRFMALLAQLVSGHESPAVPSVQR
jgi:DNA-binding MarR family transcriptional regulator